MSTPSLRLHDSQNRNADGSYTCCEGNTPQPVWAIAALFPSMAEPIRNELIRQYGKAVADEPWCPACHTFLEQLRDQAAEAGPYAVQAVATVASFVPGIGTAISATLNGGLALAQGQDISDAFVSGLKGALPGGAVTQMAFSAGQAVLEGKPIEQIGIAALPIPEGAKKLLSAGVQLAQDVANGKPVSDIMINQVYSQLSSQGKAAVDAATMAGLGPKAVAEVAFGESTKVLPPDQSDALRLGMSIGLARIVQGKVPNMYSSSPMPIIVVRPALRIDPASRVALDNAGRVLAKSDPVIAARVADALNGGVNERGFYIGLGAAAGTKTMGIYTTGKSSGQYVAYTPKQMSTAFSPEDMAKGSGDAVLDAEKFWKIWRTRELPPDAATRVALAKVGADVAATNSAIRSERASMGASQRGFDIATGLVTAKPEAIHENDSDIAWLRDGLDPETLLGFDQGIASARVRLGKNIDAHTRVSFAATGSALAAGDPLLLAARNVLKTDAERRGFDIASGMLQGSRVSNGAANMAMRSTLNPESRTGWDMGVAFHDGRISGVEIPVGLSVPETSAFLVTKGLSGQPESIRVAVATELASNPETRNGIEAGVQKKGIIATILEFFGLG